MAVEKKILGKLWKNFLHFFKNFSGPFVVPAWGNLSPSNPFLIMLVPEHTKQKFVFILMKAALHLTFYKHIINNVIGHVGVPKYSWNYIQIISIQIKKAIILTFQLTNILGQPRKKSYSPTGTFSQILSAWEIDQ